VTGVANDGGGVADVGGVLPLDHYARQLRCVGGVDDRGVDVPPFERCQRGADVLRGDDLRRNLPPEASALQVLPGVDAGGHGVRVGDGYAACSAEVSEDLETVGDDDLGRLGGDGAHRHLVGGEEDVRRRAGPNLPRQGARRTEIANNLVMCLRLVERSDGLQHVLQAGGRGDGDLFRLHGSCEKKCGQKETHRIARIPPHHGRRI